MNREENDKFNIILVICISAVAFFAVASSFVSFFSQSDVNISSKDSKVSDFSMGWKNSEGIVMSINGMIETYGFYSPEEPLILTKTNDFKEYGEMLYIHSRNLVINVSADGVPLHRTASDGVISGVPGFDNYIFVSIPGSGKKEIELEIYRTEFSDGAGVGNFLTGSEDSIVRKLFADSLFPLISGIIFTMLGIALIIFGISTRKKLESWLSSVFYGIFLTFISSGIMFDTPCSHIIFNNMIYSENSQRIFLVAALPAFLAFVDTFFITEHTYPVKILAVVSALLIPTIVILNSVGILAFVDIGLYYLIFVVICGIVTVEELLVFMIKTRCSGTPRKKRDYVSVYVFVGCTAIDVVAYLSSYVGNDDMFFTRIGLYVVSGFTLVSRFNELLDMIKLGVQAGRIGKIAFTDANTGIGNVAAFKAEFEDLESRKITYRYIGIVQFDVNNLKIINDTKGHEAGDLLIKSAADIINRSFGTIGKCYRTGGDEFVALFSGDHAPIECEEAIYKFNRLIDKFNDNPDKPFDLRIAFGVAYYQNDKTTNATLKEIHKIADDRMYDNKRSLKARFAKTPEEAIIR